MVTDSDAVRAYRETLEQLRAAQRELQTTLQYVEGVAGTLRRSWQTCCRKTCYLLSWQHHLTAANRRRNLTTIHCRI